jgi:hypothetical protein
MTGTSMNETERKCTALDGPDMLSNIERNGNLEKRSPNPELPDNDPGLTDQIKQLYYCLLFLIQDFNYNETTDRSHITTLLHLPPGVKVPPPTYSLHFSSRLAILFAWMISSKALFSLTKDRGSWSRCNGRQNRKSTSASTPTIQGTFMWLHHGLSNRFLHIFPIVIFISNARDKWFQRHRDQRNILIPFRLDLSPLNAYSRSTSVRYISTASSSINIKKPHGHRAYALRAPVLFQLLSVSDSSVKNTAHGYHKGTRWVTLLLTHNKKYKPQITRFMSLHRDVIKQVRKCT